jgi:predicted small lipoprotein YifL
MRLAARFKFPSTSTPVMPGLVPGIQAHRSSTVFMDGRDKPGHDGLGLGWGMGAIVSKLALAFAITLALGVAGCGVKNDLVLPDGKPTPKGQKDPSKPPAQQQQGL